MLNIPLAEILDKLPVKELHRTLRNFVSPIADLLPDKRLRQIVPLAVRCILASESPVIAAMAQSASRHKAQCWAIAKRFYRWLNNPRFNYQDLLRGLYLIARRTVEQQDPPYLVVAIDPVNFEKPYTRKLEGVSTVYKSTPPDHHGQARLTHGYPAITATIVNTKVPAITYANWFSYKTSDFISQNYEVHQAIQNTCSLFPERKVRFVMDSGGDDRKVFTAIQKAGAEFIIAAQHLEREVEVYNFRLQRWEREKLQDLVDCVLWEITYQTVFHHAGRTSLASVKMGWYLIRLPDVPGEMWVLVAEDDVEKGRLVLLTNVPLGEERVVKEVYDDWRLRGRIEHGYRFEQEQGLDVEDLRVRTLERMRRLFVLVLVAAQFVFYLKEHWPQEALLWLLKLGGKLGLSTDRDGPYILLRGLSAVWQTEVTLSLVAISPFPHHLFP